MTISSVSSDYTTAANALQNTGQQRRTDFSQLVQALQSGDLASAQAAYNNLVNKDHVGASASGSGQGILQDDLTAIGNALKSGDLTGAQQGLAKLEQDAKSSSSSPTASHRAHHGRHHHTHIDSDSNTSSAEGASASSGSQNSAPAPASGINLLG